LEAFIVNDLFRNAYNLNNLEATLDKLSDGGNKIAPKLITPDAV